MLDDHHLRGFRETPIRSSDDTDWTFWNTSTVHLKHEILWAVLFHMSVPQRRKRLFVTWGIKVLLLTLTPCCGSIYRQLRKPRSDWGCEANAR